MRAHAATRHLPKHAMKVMRRQAGGLRKLFQRRSPVGPSQGQVQGAQHARTMSHTRGLLDHASNFTAFCDTRLTVFAHLPAT